MQELVWPLEKNTLGKLTVISIANPERQVLVASEYVELVTFNRMLMGVRYTGSAVSWLEPHLDKEAVSRHLNKPMCPWHSPWIYTQCGMRRICMGRGK